MILLIHKYKGSSIRFGYSYYVSLCCKDGKAQIHNSEDQFFEVNTGKGALTFAKHDPGCMFNLSEILVFSVKSIYYEV